MLFVLPSLFLIFLILCYLYKKVGVYYAKGMSEYAKRNNVGANKEDTWQSIINETNELIDAIKEFSVYDIVLESADVFHTLAKHVAMSYLPVNIYCSVWLWSIYFPLNPFATFKLGLRYKKNGCLRNHNNPNNINHLCLINDKINNKIKKIE